MYLLYRKKSVATRKTLPFDVTEFEKSYLKILGAGQPFALRALIHEDLTLYDPLLLFYDTMVNLP